MKITLLALLFTVSASAYAASRALPSACGTGKANFQVTLDNSQHTPAPAEPGKARVYFIQNLGPHNYIAEINVGMDGAWVGTNRNNSYFSITVDAGKHLVCENVKSHFSTYGRLVELADFDAKPGKVYYFRARLTFGQNQPALELDQIHSDQGKHLIASYPLSVSQLKK